VQLNLIVKEVLKLLRASIPSTIEIVQNVSQEPLFLAGDPTQIHEVLVNLCTNAFQAMKDKGGVLEVRLEAETVGSGSNHSPFPEITPGRYAKISVSDTGPGLPGEVVERNLEPFSADKWNDGRIGLGLAVVPRIVANHRGHFAAFSEPGKGATFEVFLPLTAREPAEEIEEAGAPWSSGKGERILLIDDDESIVNSHRQILEHLGYNVAAKTSSPDALELFRKQPDRFDLIVTDQTMPHLTGMDLAAEMLKMRPNLPIILCTGHSDGILDEEAKRSGICEYLLKPVSMRRLAEATESVLRIRNGKTVMASTRLDSGA
jgi:CheY-like chemotaxis protein